MENVSKLKGLPSSEKGFVAAGTLLQSSCHSNNKLEMIAIAEMPRIISNRDPTRGLTHRSSLLYILQLLI